MPEDSLSTSEVEIKPPEFIDKEEEAEAAFWRLKRAADLWRENRVKRILAQEGESIFRTLGRILYIISCIIFDGLILIELPIYMGRSAAAWTIYILLLIFAVRLQYEYYKKWFEVDISQIEFENP
ncbi:MAG: hypothetical protein MKZ53_05925 [Candidatus Thalassarchaeum sp.]|jgi:hypothetical protein|nr:hypothetical protein [Candidatus Thalassarchaeum sp.]